MTNPDRDAWATQLFDQLVEAGVTLFPYVPDAGNARLIEGVLLGMGIDVARVNPKDWQKIALPGVKGREALKLESIRVARDRFPGLNLYPTKRCRKESDNISDAAHIAWVGSRCSAGGTA